MFSLQFYNLCLASKVELHMAMLELEILDGHNVLFFPTNLFYSTVATFFICGAFICPIHVEKTRGWNNYQPTFDQSEVLCLIWEIW